MSGRTKFRVGDLVSRPKNVYDSTSTLLHGTITRVYSDTRSRFGPYPELYEVTWADGRAEKGFLPHGLNHDD